jgi:hypothetical protein
MRTQEDKERASRTFKVEEPVAPDLEFQELADHL